MTTGDNPTATNFADSLEEVLTIIKDYLDTTVTDIVDNHWNMENNMLIVRTPDGNLLFKNTGSDIFMEYMTTRVHYTFNGTPTDEGVALVLHETLGMMYGDELFVQVAQWMKKRSRSVQKLLTMCRQTQL